MSRFGDKYEPLGVSGQGGKSLLEKIQILDPVAHNYQQWMKIFLDLKLAEGLGDDEHLEKLMMQFLGFF